MKKIVILLIGFFGLVTSAQAYDTQTKLPCTILSQFGNTKYFLVRGMYDKDTYSKKDITVLQNFLAARYGLKQSDFVTGYFGKTTESYIKKYQKESGLTQSGMVGQGTRAKMRLDSECSVGAVSITATTTPETTYQSLTTSGKVTILYPTNNWKVQPEKSFFSKTVTEIKSEVGDVPSDDTLNAQVVITTDNSFQSAKSLEDIVKDRISLLKTISSNDQKYQVLKNQSTTINGNEALVLEEVFPTGEGTSNYLMRLRTIYIKKNDTLTIVEMVSLDSAWGKYVNIFDVISSKLTIN